MSTNVPLLELKGITKTFGSFTANEDINLTVYPGEVHALLGENGAGKSTLMNVIYGIYKPDRGSIHLNGKQVKIQSPKDALRHGVGMVHQHFMLVNVFSAIENIYLMGEERGLSFIRKKDVETKLEDLKSKYGIDVDIHSPVEQLSIGMQQKVEILKLLYTGADVLIFDEPTAVLLPQECDGLFEIIENLVNEGKGVIFISHKLDEVLKISNRITVLTKGRVTGQIDTGDADKEIIVRMMVGEDVEIPDLEKTHIKKEGKTPVLRVENVQAKDDRGVKTLNGVSLSVYPGEVVGIASVEGNGQTELAEVMAGVRKAIQGKVMIEEQEVPTKSAKVFIDKSIAYVPADRNYTGSVPDFPLYENWILRNRKPPKRGPLLDYRKIRVQAASAMQDYDVRARSIYDRSANLSGGNLQKFILARALGKRPKALICAYPTRGLDIKATWFIREKILEARKEGMGVLLLSGDFEELFALSDRIVVLYRGKVVGEVLPEETSVREVGMMMMGVTADETH
ncbi:ABC transporter ATP-binding protein [Clostridium sp. chh4-2]|uniref:ABC transporter ATP-binding protein n=1 Tax=Clostridium sp. chh4-2 TaxID=2067550 RepID=UPI000CCF935C|nr:ABC transporter ATP-binding protein [Clostridium sp. chh4-2]PNV58960.1 ABC transporter ATP-binding protein [Clostridium sp. chh4-2]